MLTLIPPYTTVSVKFQVEEIMKISPPSVFCVNVLWACSAGSRQSGVSGFVSLAMAAERLP